MKKLCVSLVLMCAGALAQDGPSVKFKRGVAEQAYTTVAAGYCVSTLLTVVGARPGDYVLPAWTELGPGTTGTMFVQRADTIEARVCAIQPSFIMPGRVKALVVSIRSDDRFDSSLLVE